MQNGYALATSKKKTEKESEKKMWLLYGLLAALLITYALWNNGIIGFAVFVLIILILYMEFKASVKSEGTTRTLYDVIIAVVAVFALWLILAIVLQTGSPIDVVASCSMLPNLQRGDLVIIKGITNVSQFISSYHVPFANAPQDSFSNMLQNMRSEWLVYYAYNPNNKSFISTAFRGSNASIGLYNYKCLITYNYTRQYQYFSRCSVNSTDQKSNLIRYNYSIGNIIIDKSASRIVFTSSINIANTSVSANYNNPIIVYSTTPKDNFARENIIHRVYAIIKSGPKYYFLTKGDNNPGLDIEFANYPVNQSNAIGYVVARVPVVGYLKLIISGQLSSVAGCNEQIQH